MNVLALVAFSCNLAERCLSNVPGSGNMKTKNTIGQPAQRMMRNPPVMMNTPAIAGMNENNSGVVIEL